jgi:Tfp pilus assembly protein PilN
MFLVTLLIVGFCCVAGVGLAKDAQTPTPEQQRATLTTEFKQLSSDYQTEALRKENAELKMDRIAKRAGEVQAQLKALASTANTGGVKKGKDAAKSPTGKDKGK